MDPIILAAHVLPKPGDELMDIGCGCGIMPMILGTRHPDVKITGIEIQDELAAMAKKNVNARQMGDRIRILNRDIGAVSPKDIDHPVDIIISNPPYKKRHTGRINPNFQKAIARHEIKLDLDMLFSRTRRFLKPMGSLTIIFPAQRIADIVRAMDANGFSPHWFRFVHIKKGQPARLVLASGLKSRTDSLTIRPPLFIHDANGRPTKEFAEITLTEI